MPSAGGDVDVGFGEEAFEGRIGSRSQVTAAEPDFCVRVLLVVGVIVADKDKTWTSCGVELIRVQGDDFTTQKGDGLCAVEADGIAGGVWTGKHAAGMG